MLDNNGFVVISESTEHTGRFFGQIDGTIMDSLVQDRIYRRVALMDYQGTCSDHNNPYSAAPPRAKHPISWLLKYVMTLASTWVAMIPEPVQAWANYQNQEYVEKEDDYAEDYEVDADPMDHNAYEPQPEPEPTSKPEINTNNNQPKVPATPTTAGGRRVPPDPFHARPCDLKTDLYVLQPERLNSSTPLKVKMLLPFQLDFFSN